tara:strand:- start:216 stop:947 length:732 start_codon:yes stop_codon:yes gene_type:complete
MPTKKYPKLYKALIRFQVDRLKGTYGDFLEKKEYREITQFFLHEVYTTRDVTERNNGFKKVYEKFKGKLGSSLVNHLAKLVDLNDLSEELDLLMVSKLHQMGVGDKFSEDEYEEAYYLTDAYNERKEQIELIVKSLQTFHMLSKYRSIGLTLSVIRPYALMKGARNLMDFMQGGYKVFRITKDVSPFEKAIEDREMERLDRIYSLGKRPPTIAELRKRAKEMGIKGADRMTLRKMMQEMSRWV